MEQFSLDKWLKDKSRKVTTRLGNREVRIICWDRKDSSNRPIITLMIGPDGNEYTTFHTKNGFVWETEKYIDKRDLFFADEELTEFEKSVKSICKHLKAGDLCDIHDLSNNLLDLARKELIPIQDTVVYQEGIKEGRRLERQDIDKELDEAYKSRDEVVYLEGYDKGHEDALKDLPKFKKTTENKEFDKHVLLFEDEERVVLTTELYKDEYYIELDDLKTLPKEE